MTTYEFIRTQPDYFELRVDGKTPHGGCHISKGFRRWLKTTWLPGGRYVDKWHVSYSKAAEAGVKWAKRNGIGAA